MLLVEVGAVVAVGALVRNGIMMLTNINWEPGAGFYSSVREGNVVDNGSSVVARFASEEACVVQIVNGDQIPEGVVFLGDDGCLSA